MEAFEDGKKFEAREEHLLKGILYGLNEFFNDPKPWHQQKDKDTWLYLLDLLGNGFGFESPEKMILDVAYDLREKNGNDVSRIVLEVGLHLMPQSSKIKSDLICDLWAIISDQGAINNILFDQIDALIKEIDIDAVHSDAKEIVSYYGLCSLVLGKKRKKIHDYMQKYIYPNVSKQTLKKKIKLLLENENSITPQELRIV